MVRWWNVYDGMKTGIGPRTPRQVLAPSVGLNLAACCISVGSASAEPAPWGDSMESSPLMTWAFATWIELRWAVRSRALSLPVCRDAIAAGLWARSLKGEGGKLRVIPAD